MDGESKDTKNTFVWYMNNAQLTKTIKLCVENDWEWKLLGKPRGASDNITGGIQVKMDK